MSFPQGRVLIAPLRPLRFVSQPSKRTCHNIRFVAILLKNSENEK
jgi:hypothetical protein